MVKQLKGGEFIGQGTYGCVFYPAKPCSSNGIAQVGVSKVFADTKSMEEEFKETEKIQKMDPNNEYTNKVLEKCKATRSSFDDDDKYDCDWINHTINDHSDEESWTESPSQVELERKGNDAFGKLPLDQLIYKHKGVDFQEFLKNVDKNYKTLSEAFDHILSFAKGVAMLQKHKYVHMDLKPPNTLVTDSKKGILIDFGISRHYDKVYDLKESGYLLESHYPYFPPEFTLFMTHIEKENNVITEKDMGYVISELENKYIYIGNKLMRRIDNEVTPFITEMMNIKSEENYTSVKQYYTDNFVSKVDVFSIGVIMLETLGMWNRKNITPSTEEKKLLETYSELAENTTSLNPFTRPSITQVVKELEKIRNSRYKNDPYVGLKPSTPKRSTPKPSTPKRSTIKPATIKPSTPKRSTPKPSTPKRSTIKPATIKPSTPKRSTPKPSTPKRSTIKPATIKPSTPKRSTIKPATIKPATIKPSTIKPSITKPAKPVIFLDDDDKLKLCMKTHNVVNLKKIIDEKGLPRALKSKKKLDMCVGVIPYLTPKYQTADLKIKPSDGKKTSKPETVMKGNVKNKTCGVNPYSGRCKKGEPKGNDMCDLNKKTNYCIKNKYTEAAMYNKVFKGAALNK
jgi:thiamine kinase-like enzyme